MSQLPFGCLSLVDVTVAYSEFVTLSSSCSGLSRSVAVLAVPPLRCPPIWDRHYSTVASKNNVDLAVAYATLL